MVAYPHGQIRAVTHHGVTAPDIEQVILAVAGALRDTTRVPAAGATR
jgi:hypothetical protein